MGRGEAVEGGVTVGLHAPASALPQDVDTDLKSFGDGDLILRCQGLVEENLVQLSGHHGFGHGWATGVGRVHLTIR